MLNYIFQRMFGPGVENAAYLPSTTVPLTAATGTGVMPRECLKSIMPYPQVYQGEVRTTIGIEGIEAGSPESAALFDMQDYAAELQFIAAYNNDPFGGSIT